MNQNLTLNVDFSSGFWLFLRGKVDDGSAAVFCGNNPNAF
jgi:hypothetical protein